MLRLPSANRRVKQKKQNRTMVLFLRTLYLYYGSDAGSIIVICRCLSGHKIVYEPLVLIVFFLASKA